MNSYPTSFSLKETKMEDSIWLTPPFSSLPLLPYQHKIGREETYVSEMGVFGGGIWERGEGGGNFGPKWGSIARMMKLLGYSYSKKNLLE